MDMREEKTAEVLWNVMWLHFTSGWGGIPQKTKAGNNCSICLLDVDNHFCHNFSKMIAW